MQWLATVLVVSSAILAVTIAQGYEEKGSGYHSQGSGYHSQKGSGYYQKGSRYNSQPTYSHNTYRPPTHGGYNTGYNTNPHGQYGGYNQWKHYEKCYPRYDEYATHELNQIRYLESADEEALNTNRSNFQPPPGVVGPPGLKCPDGPKRILHSERYEWHWPPIYKGICDNLPGCRDPKCISTKTVKKSACVLVFRQYGYRWVRVGYQKIFYKTDESCKCRQCRDIKNHEECVHEHPCPNEGTRYSYCFWKKPRYTPYERTYTDDHEHNTYTPHDKKTYTPPPHNDKKPTYGNNRYTRQAYGQKGYGSHDKKTYNTHQKGYGNRYDDHDDKDGYSDPYDPKKHMVYPKPPGTCECCEPRLCKPPRKFDYDKCECVCPKKKCLPGHKFNPETCKCECPEGTTFDKHKQKCIGKCKELEGKACEYVLCKDNPHFYCKLDKKYKCRCPSCKDVDYWEKELCKKTNCIEQKYKPYCVFDERNGKCRCPECEDQKTPNECEKTSCIDKYRQKYCKWVWYPYPTCQCGTPHYGPPTSKYGNSHHQPGYGNSHKTSTPGYGDSHKTPSYDNHKTPSYDNHNTKKPYGG